MDTAPRDGRRVLVKFASSVVCPGHWAPELESWSFDLSNFPPGYCDWNAPTVGWRPLGEQDAAIG